MVQELFVCLECFLWLGFEANGFVAVVAGVFGVAAFNVAVFDSFGTFVFNGIAVEQLNVCHFPSIYLCSVRSG